MNPKGERRGSEDRRASALAELSLLLTVFFFGTNFVAVKLVVESAPPLLFAAVRFTLAGLLLLLLLRVLEGGSRPGGRGEALRLLGLGAVGITLTQSFFTFGVSLTTATNTALMYSTSPIWGMLLGSLLGLERPGLRNILGVALALLGVGLVVYGGLELGGTSLVGDLLILAAAVCWGSYTMLSLALLGRYSPLAVAAYPMLLGGLAIFPLAVFDLDVDVGAIGGVAWFAALSTRCSSRGRSGSSRGSGASRASGRTGSSCTSTSSRSSGWARASRSSGRASGPGRSWAPSSCSRASTSPGAAGSLRRDLFYNLPLRATARLTGGL